MSSLNTFQEKWARCLNMKYGKIRTQPEREQLLFSCTGTDQREISFFLFSDLFFVCEFISARTWRRREPALLLRVRPQTTRLLDSTRREMWQPPHNLFCHHMAWQRTRSHLHDFHSLLPLHTSFALLQRKKRCVYISPQPARNPNTRNLYGFTEK